MPQTNLPLLNKVPPRTVRRPHCAPPPGALSRTFLPVPLADNVYITNLDDQNTQQFVEELQKRLQAAAAAAASGSGASGMFLSQSHANLAGAAGVWPEPNGVQQATTQKLLKSRFAIQCQWDKQWLVPVRCQQKLGHATSWVRRVTVQTLPLAAASFTRPCSRRAVPEWP